MNLFFYYLEIKEKISKTFFNKDGSKIKTNPCDCCENRTSLSVCANEAKAYNWEDIQKMKRPGNIKE